MAPASMWNCSACGTQGLLATSHQHCPACGAEQDLTTHHLSDEPEEVVAANHLHVGRDLACVVCHSLNSALSNNCGGCGLSLVGAREMPDAGASRSGARRADTSGAGRSSASLSRSGTSRSGMSRSDLSRSGMRRSGASRSGMRPSDSLQAEIDAERERKAEIVRKRLVQVSDSVAVGEAQRARRRMVLALAGVIVGALVFFARSRTKADEATVLAHGWARSIAIEQFGERVGTARCDRLPPGSEKLGPRGGPDMCGYRVTEWQVVREVERSGEGLDSAREWPEYRLRWTGQGDCQNCEREGERREIFVLRLRYQGQIHECEVDRGLWELVADGDSAEVPDASEAGVLDCGVVESLFL